MKTYQMLFDTRGGAYDHAMRCHPDARRQEFEQVIAAVRTVPGMRIADVPAGGGYLQDYLPAGCTWLGHEPCASFSRHGAVPLGAAALLPLPWQDASVDAAISLAGVHHLEDKRSLFAELHRVVKPGGRLVVSDVAEGSAVALFLDGYVGANNSTGHEGMFLSDQTQREMHEVGWSVEQAELCHFHWQFADRDTMAAFCHHLFDLRTSSQADTREAIESQLGVVQIKSGLVGMCWSLMTITAVRE